VTKKKRRGDQLVRAFQFAAAVWPRQSNSQASPSQLPPGGLLLVGRVLVGDLLVSDEIE